MADGTQQGALGEIDCCNNILYMRAARLTPHLLGSVFVIIIIIIFFFFLLLLFVDGGGEDDAHNGYGIVSINMNTDILEIIITVSLFLCEFAMCGVFQSIQAAMAECRLRAQSPSLNRSASSAAMAPVPALVPGDIRGLQHRPRQRLPAERCVLTFLA